MIDLLTLDPKKICITGIIAAIPSTSSNVDKTRSTVINKEYLRDWLKIDFENSIKLIIFNFLNLFYNQFRSNIPRIFRF